MLMLDAHDFVPLALLLGRGALCGSPQMTAAI